MILYRNIHIIYSTQYICAYNKHRRKHKCLNFTFAGNLTIIKGNNLSSISFRVLDLYFKMEFVSFFGSTLTYLLNGCLHVHKHELVGTEKRIFQARCTDSCVNLNTTARHNRVTLAHQIAKHTSTSANHEECNSLAIFTISQRLKVRRNKYLYTLLPQHMLQ